MTTRVAVAVLAATSLMLASGCGDTSEPRKVDSSDYQESPPDWTVSPDSEPGRDYLQRLRAVHPDLGDDRTLAWGKYMCRDFLDGAIDPRDEPGVLQRVKVRYAGGARPPLSDEQARMIVAAVTTDICPEYAPE